jgi:signal transduction histidine kinase
LAISGDRLIVRVRKGKNWQTMQPGVRVLIYDNGPGIPPKARSHLFQLFNTTKGEKSTGIGLWASKGIVKTHGGTICFRSSDGFGKSGTVFSVFLPNPASVEHQRNKNELPHAS